MKKLIIVSVLLFVFAAFQLSQSAFAQEAGLNLTASPTSYDLVAAPETTLHETLRIRNNTDTPVNLTVSLKKLVADANGQITLQDFQKGDDYAQWISIENASISARLREWVDIPFTLTVPNTAAFSYYWAIVVSQTNQHTTLTGPQAKITGAVAIPVLLAIRKNGLVFSGSITSFQSSQNFYEYLPATFNLTFKNSGNVHIKPRGNIFITDWTGKQVDTIGFNTASANVLPGSQRTFTTIWDNGFITSEEKIEDGKILTDANGKPQTELKIHFDRLLNFRIGKYSATALVVVSGDKRDYSFEQTTNFYVFPWKIIMGIIILVLLAGIGLANTVKSIIFAIKKLFKKKE
ncbi:MAG: hypothetical protein KGJ07_02805 [Patescibacteria group bacterium]|nr:hypothetical protein [Patescibacteria group bacterium]MDE2591037.1 hypothetical protein [Patescibacteria group bacterium]